MPKTSRYDLPQIGAGLGEINRFTRESIQGHLNVAGEIVLLNGSTATSLFDPLFSGTTEVVLIPRDAASAAVLWWLQLRNRGEIIIGHQDPGADRTFGYIAIG